MIEIATTQEMSEYMAVNSGEMIRFPRNANVWLDYNELSSGCVEQAEAAANVAGRSLHMR